jgi:hypothetical protein
MISDNFAGRVASPACDIDEALLAGLVDLAHHDAQLAAHSLWNATYCV